MIGSLTGLIKRIDTPSILVEVAGIGYEVMGSNNLLNSISLEESPTIYIAHVVREDSEVLYGFKSYEERKLFDLLLSVSGIGPKLALLIVGSFSLTDVIDAIQNGSAALFESVSGIGNKNARRIIIELQPKLGSLQDIILTDLGQSEAADALVSLGYKHSEIRKVLHQIDSTLSVDKQIKEALRRLSS